MLPGTGASLATGSQLHRCSRALGSSLAHRGQKRLCWCPLEGHKVPVWHAEPQPCGTLSVPDLGSPHVLQVLCNLTGKLAYWDHRWELKWLPKLSPAGDLMCFCYLVASVTISPARTVHRSDEQQGSLVCCVPRDKLADLAAVEGLF